MADLAIPIAPNLAPFDPNVSNGTCFFAAGRVHTAGYIPCGNSGSPGAGGSTRSLPCCLAGDYCQSSNACYSPSTDNVYLAGCTDPEYKASTCPYKSPAYAGQEWVGMVWSCEARQQMGEEKRPSPLEDNLVDRARNMTALALHNHSNSHGHDNQNSTAAATAGGSILSSDKNNNSTGAPGFIVLNQNSDGDDGLISWSGCPLPHPGSVVPERMYNMCDPCSPQRDGLFRDGKYLTRVAKLPAGVGGVVQWESGFGPGVAVTAQTTSMSSCVSTMSTAAAGVATFGTGVSPTATDASSSGETNTGGGAGGDQDGRHPAGDRTNIIVGSTSAVIIVLLAAALAWLLTKRHQRKRQERQVIRETHLALARGPSPPQLMAFRGGSGYLASDGTAPAGVEDFRAGEMLQQQKRSDTPEMAGRGAASLLSPAGSVHRVPSGKRAAQLPRMNSTRSARGKETPQLPRTSQTVVAAAQRWSTATDMTANTTSSSMAMTAQTTNTSTDVTTMTPVSPHTPKFLRTRTATSPLLLARKTSMSSMSTCSISGVGRDSTGYFSCPRANVQQSEDGRGVQNQDVQNPGQDIAYDGRHNNETTCEQGATPRDHPDENNPPSKTGSDHNCSHDSDSEGEESININDDDDSESLSSYQGGTIAEVQKLRIRVVDSNTARLLILGKKPEKNDMTHNEEEGSGAHSTSSTGEQ